MKKNVVALRDFTHADDSFAKNDVILGMETGHFNDWSADGVDLVREATAAEVARARGEPTAKARKAAPKRKAKAPAAVVSAPAAPVDTAPVPDAA